MADLTPRQQRAITALLAKHRVADAAAESGVSQRSLYRWMQEPAFHAELMRRESALLDDVTRRLLAYVDAAVTTLVTIMASKGISPAVRVRAAEVIITSLLRIRELRDVEARLTALEEALHV